MNIQTVNKERFVEATTIIKGVVYRFDLSPASTTAKATKYHFVNGWTFEIQDQDGGEVTYSIYELRARLASKTIWKKLTK